MRLVVYHLELETGPVPKMPRNQEDRHRLGYCRRTYARNCVSSLTRSSLSSASLSVGGLLSELRRRLVRNPDEGTVHIREQVDLIRCFGLTPRIAQFVCTFVDQILQVILGT